MCGWPLLRQNLFQLHDMISTTVHPKNTQANNYGPGYQKMSLSVLNYQPFQNDLTKLVEELHNLDHSFINEQGEINHLLTWDIWKTQILECALHHAKELKHDVYKEIKQIQDKIIKNDTSENYSPHIRFNLLQNLKEKLNIINEDLFLRSHQEQVEKDEKPTAYFYAKMAKSKENHNIDVLTFTDETSNERKTTHDPDIIMDKAHDFYQKLYSEEPPNINTQNWLIDHLNSKLSANSRENLEKDLTEEEFKTSIKEMQNGKSPGIDGIPKEFYQKFWSLIKNKFIEVTKQILIFQKMTKTQQEAVLKLLYKKDEKDDLKNWRPISLLCADYKIITKTLAK